jgi:hypothetical protein
VSGPVASPAELTLTAEHQRGLGPADDASAVTAAQLREVVTRLVHAGQWRPGDPDILIVMDSGYASYEREMPDRVGANRPRVPMCASQVINLQGPQWSWPEQGS